MTTWLDLLDWDPARATESTPPRPLPEPLPSALLLPETPRLDTAVQRYLGWFEHELGASPRTVEGYRGILRKLADHYADLQLDDFEPPRGTELIRDLYTARWAGTAPGTRNKVISAFRSFFSWAVECDYLLGNPTTKIRRPKVVQTERHVPSIDEVKWIIQAQADPRDRVVLTLMARLGLRKNEVRLLQWRHVNLATGELTVTAKGKGVVTVPVCYPEIVDALAAAQLHRMAGPDEYVLFPHKVSNYPNSRGMVVFENRLKPLGTSSMHRWWTGCLARAKVAHFGMHSLRHTAITEFLRATNGNLALAQKFARHASITTTINVYGHLSTSDLMLAMRQAGEAWA